MASTKRQQQEDLIIDLQGSKILEWLLDRKKLPQHWKRNSPAVRKLIDDAIKVAPPIKQQHQSLTADDLNYLICQDILQDYLSAPNGSSKTLFGSYSNPATQKWSDIIKAYQKDSLHIGDLCQQFTQAINYDVPNLKKTIEKSLKSLDDYNKREQELNKSKTASQNMLKKACQDLGIQGDSIRDEIIVLPKSLETMFGEVIKQLNNGDMIKIISFYQEVIKATSVELKDEILPLTNMLVKNGNITLAEREAILDPAYRPPASAQSNSQQQTSTDASTGTGGGINWDIDLVDETPVDVAVQEIKWDEDFSVIDTSNTTDQILDDFSMMEAIEIVDESQSPALVSSSEPVAVVADLSADNGAPVSESRKKANENPNESILGDRQLRNLFLDELYELEMFLKHRTAEMQAPEHVFGIDQLSIESTNLEQCKTYLKTITSIIAALTNHKIKHVLEIKSSKKYIDRLVLQFSQKQFNIAKNTQLIVDLDTKRQEANHTLLDSRKKLEQLTKDTRQLKSRLEKLLEEILDGKQANIMIPNVF
ncbi:hypothetical protein SAMD00019534_041590 [Acytostelium subglobosum LB1]|uniref:hypothetical protein n=1 Tax=Acytostelium subglobosum LB1 TaxID=1410327 RepID=UPI000644BE46|nr:hypothetical protein SAMD00019534_041590 [Acytostelium subglobosum LB1]GAM20984.1 hypothetical protein SAMD00019534_041590 [Acytostelium subglobosum LB1]|eukprot:XP_012756118.1 hypothetical protein SAMD00019534_041590 [Acytostelium subglobosum LB1]